MPVSGTAISAIIMAGLRKSPEQRDQENREATAEIARRGAIETTRYNAMSDREKREYDDLTYGMMPHLAGAREYWRERSGGSRTGGRDD